MSYHYSQEDYERWQVERKELHSQVALLESQLAEAQERIDALESEMNPQDVQRVDSQLSAARNAGALRAKPEEVSPKGDEAK